VSTDAIIHAVTSEFPLTRYDVAKAGKFPVKLISWLWWALPDEVTDFYIEKKYAC